MAEHREWAAELGRASFAAADEAVRLGDGRIDDDHLLLALVRAGEDTPAARALRACGATYERLAAALARGEPGPADDERSFIMLATSPAAHRLEARAEGIALGADAAAVTAEHVLVAFLWEPETERLLERCGTTREAVRDALAGLGAHVPPALPPSPPPCPDGPRQHVDFREEELPQVLRRLVAELPEGAHWGWNVDREGGAWVDGVGDFDLEEQVRAALAPDAQ